MGLLGTIFSFCFADRRMSTTDSVTTTRVTGQTVAAETKTRGNKRNTKTLGPSLVGENCDNEQFPSRPFGPTSQRKVLIRF